MFENARKKNWANIVMVWLKHLRMEHWDFLSSKPIDTEEKIIEDVIQAIKNNEAIVAIDASVEDKIMEGAFTIEDDYRINRCKSELVSNQ